MAKDKSQLKVIFAPVNASYLVTAPPGYGKTYTMTKRIEFIIKFNKIPKSKKILGLTFTNSAANEMYQRINIPKQKKQDFIEIFTFHSLCYNILRGYGRKVDLPNNFELLWETEKKGILKNIFKKIIDFREVPNFFERYEVWITEKLLRKNLEYIDENYEEQFTKGYQNYNLFLNSIGKIDFNILLIKTIELWHKFPSILEFCRNKYGLILVDEFQDTNNLQYEILSNLIKGTEKNEQLNFMCFGDSFQSIYIFQGAMGNEIHQILIDFQSISLELEMNHRNPIPLINAINNSLRNGIEPIDILDNLIPSYLFKTIDEEAGYIVKEIQNLKKTTELHEICVVSRSYYRLIKIKEDLTAANIDFIYFEDFRPESIEEKYSDIFEELDGRIKKTKERTSLTTLIQNICTENSINYKEDLILNVFIEFIKKFEKENRQVNINLCDVLVQIRNDMTLQLNWGEIIRKKVKNKIFVSSIHQVKGMEFSNVFLIGAENFNRACDYSKICRAELTEELNLLYVALTRTKASIIQTFISNMKNKEGEWKRRWVFCVYQKLELFFQFIDFESQNIIPLKDIMCFKLKSKVDN